METPVIVPAKDWPHAKPLTPEQSRFRTLRAQGWTARDAFRRVLTERRVLDAAERLQRVLAERT